MTSEKDQATKTGTVAMSEHDLKSVSGGASRLPSSQAAQADGNVINTEELTIVHEHIVRT